MRRLVLLSSLVSAVLLGVVAAGWAAGPSGSVVHTDAHAFLLGNRGLARAHGTDQAGRAEAFRFTAVRSGVAREIRLYVDRSNRSSVVAVAVYASVGGHPGRLLTGSSLRHPRSERWNRIAIRGTRIRRGDRYWIAVLGTGGRLVYRSRRDPACGRERSARTHLGALPARWRAAGNLATCAVSAYLSGTLTKAPRHRKSATRPKTRAPKAGTPPRTGPPPTTGSPPGTGTPPTGTPSRSSSCFSAPGACGYPDPAYGTAGSVAACSSLRPSRSITVSGSGQTIQNLNVTGTITVTGANATIDNVCVTTNGGGQLGSTAITVTGNASNTLIENTTVAGANSSNQSVEIAAANWSGNSATISHDYFHNCGECVHDGPWTVNDSYIITDGMQGTSDHYEDVYCNNTTITMNHDTALNPEEQVATVFCDTNDGGGGPCSNHVTVSNSLLAGGGYTVYACGNASSVGSSTMNITGNRFVRCLTRPLRQTADGGWDCQGNTGESIGSGADSHGYWPYGGHYGVDSGTYCPRVSGQTWSSNVWDDSSAGVSC
jgi:hypothetical protein